MSAEGLTLAGITLRFGGHTVLDNIDLHVPEGCIHAVIGPNGAGKSTLFSVVAGEHIPQHGTIHLGGRDISHVPGYRRVRLGIARAFQVAHIFGELTVSENVVAAVIAARRGGMNFWSTRRMRSDKVVADNVLEQFKLGDLAQTRARELSQGDRKRLEIAMSLALRPSVLLLDEPTAGMSPEETASTVSLVREVWQSSHLTVLLTEHDMKVIFDLAEQLTVLNAGKILATGEPAAVRRRADVREVYLGHDDGTA